MMTPEEFTKKMSQLEGKNSNDEGMMLVEATELMGTVLRQQGYSAGISILERAIGLD